MLLAVRTVQYGMRIGIDCRLPYYQMGGISQYTLHLLSALANLDRDNSYVVFQSRKDGRSHTPRAQNFRRANLWTPCHHRLERFALSAELLRHGLDVFHSPDFIPPLRGAKRHIITVHDLNFILYPQLLTAESLRYYAGQIGWAVSKADHISADSHATRRDLIDRLGVPPEKVTTIHLSVNPVYQRPYSAASINQTLVRFNLPRGFILAVGTLEPRKNYPTLIEAYARLRQEKELDVPLVLVGGKGWIYDAIFAKIDALHLRDHVRHLNGVFDETLAHLYHSAGVLVTPSLYEGFGLPALEAMNCGCPVVVSRRGSLPEIVGPNGLMVDEPVDPAAWADAIGRVLDDSEFRERQIAYGRAHAKTFSWRKAAKKTLALYRGEAVEEELFYR